MPETLDGIIVRDADKIDFIGIGRWKQCIEEQNKCNSILELLPTYDRLELKYKCN